MANPAVESANFVLGHFLTKSGSLGIGDIRIMQRALIESGHASFDEPNGVLGPGTSDAILDFISSEDGIHLAQRLSESVTDGLSAQGKEDDLKSVRGTAHAIGAGPDNLERASIQSLIAQPHALSSAETVFLHTKLYEAGLYELDSDEFTKFADGSPMKVYPNDQIGRHTISAIADYIKANPTAVLQNPEIINRTLNMGDGWDDVRREMAVDSTTYGQRVFDLIENNTGQTASSVNYHLQVMLLGGDFGGRPDGGVGPSTQQSIDLFNETINPADSLRSSWGDGQGVDGTQAPAVEPDGIGTLIATMDPNL